eukprot:4981633-Amphidinium_carterae.1
MLKDVKSNNLADDFNWERSCGPFALTMSPQCALADRVPQGHTIDAKAVFDALYSVRPRDAKLIAEQQSTCR